MSEPFISEIKLMPTTYAPRGFAYCDGQIIAIAQNETLFSLLGTQFGGDGRTSFGIPDLRGRTPIGVHQGPGLTERRQGQFSGAEYVQLTTAEMLAHSHSLGASNSAGNSGDPTDRVLAATGSIPASVPITDVPVTGKVESNIPVSVKGQTGSTTAEGTLKDAKANGSASTTISVNLYSSSAPNIALSDTSIGNTGGSQKHLNMMPYLVLSYVIALVGLYPSRN